MDDSETQELIKEFDKKPRRLVDPCNIDTNSRKYWQDIFKTMDEYSAVPYHKRENVLQTVLNDAVLIKRLKAIYDIYKHDEIINFDEYLSTGLGDAISVPDIQDELRPSFVDYDDSVYVPLSEMKFKYSRKSPVSFISPESREIRMPKRPTLDYRRLLTKDKDEVFIEEGGSMYANFLSKPPEKAKRWRPKPPLTLDGMSLAAKCDAITREIATDFVEWMDGLGGDTKSVLDVASIEGLFEIGFNCHAADSLRVNIQELNAVTEYVAHARQTPEQSFSTQLYRQLYRDKTAVRSREANYAFGTMIPPEMRTGTSEDSDVSKWLENKRVPEKLLTMAVVWENIESLKSTEGYCNWLQEHENIKPPSYLVSKGLLEVETLGSALGAIGSNTQSQSQGEASSSSSSSSNLN